MSFSGRILVPALVVAVLISTTNARAELPAAADQDVRSKLIDDAKQASGAGDHEKALSLLLQAAEIRLTPSLRYFLASEQQALKLYADAYVNAELCEREAKSNEEAQLRPKLLHDCPILKTELADKIGYIVVRPASLPPGLVVKVAGRAVPSALVGRAYLVAAGPVTVEVTAPGFSPFKSTFVVTNGPSMDVPVNLVAEAKPEETAPPPASLSPCPPGFVRQGGDCVLENPAPVAVISTTESRVDEQPRAKHATTPWFIGAGAAAVLSGVTYLLSHSTFTSSRDGGCPSSTTRNCSNDASTVDAYNTVSKIGLVGAIVAGGIGLGIAFTNP